MMNDVATQDAADQFVEPPAEKMLTGSGNLQVNYLDGKMFLDVDSVPWTPFSIPGNFFKILMIDGERSTLFMKQTEDAVLNPHRHDTPVELFLLEGSVGYRDDATGKEYRINKNGYMYEPPGTIHSPVTSGAIGICILNGPITGFNAEGEEVSVSAQDLYEMAKRNNAVAHLKPRNVDWA
jgi:mannose-6-phosphate isomerase-like protein (cupin superfamily)